MNLNATDNLALPETARFGYIPGLDGLRALAVIIVLIAHLGFEHIVPGGFGVTVFFFISGFLITRLLLAESDKQGGIGLKNFYTRRIVRLYPALLFMVFGSMLLFYLGQYGGPTPWELAAAIGYFTNIFQVVVRTGGELPFMPWTHLWSLAVEEHFYLIFPLLMALTNRKWRRTAGVLIGVIVAAVLWRTYILMGTSLPVQDYNYMMTDTRLDSLAWGCLLSIMLHVAKDHLKFKSLIGLFPTVLAVGGILVSFLIRDETFRYTVRYTLQGAALFVLFLNFYYWSAVRFVVKWFEFRPLAWIGQVSYALYLWHVPIYDLVHRSLDRSPASLGLTIALSFGISAFSFYIVEKPFVALRRKFGSHAIKREAVLGNEKASLKPVEDY